MNIKTTQTKSDLLKNVKRLKEKPTKFRLACCRRFANSFVTKHCSRKTNNVGSSRERLVKNPLNILEKSSTSEEPSWEFCTTDRHSRRRLEGQRGTNGPRISESPTPESAHYRWMNWHLPFFSLKKSALTRVTQNRTNINHCNLKLNVSVLLYFVFEMIN